MAADAARCGSCGSGPGPDTFDRMILITLIDMYSLVVLAAVVMSWIGVARGNPLVDFIVSLTEPVLAPIRRVLPPMAGLDFSPMVLLVGLRFLRGIVARTVF